MNTEVVSVAFLVAFVALSVWFVLFKRWPKAQPLLCPHCATLLQEAGFLSWNGGSDGAIAFATSGIAKPTANVVGTLQGLAAEAPSLPGQPEVRLVGAVTLCWCPSCGVGFTVERGTRAVVPCPAETWKEMTAGP